MKPKTYFAVTLGLFIVVAAFHLFRILADWDLVLGDYNIPMSVSWVAVIVVGLLAYHAYQLEEK